MTRWKWREPWADWHDPFVDVAIVVGIVVACVLLISGVAFWAQMLGLI